LIVLHGGPILGLEALSEQTSRLATPLLLVILMVMSVFQSIPNGSIDTEQLVADQIAATSGGTRHIYTFADGSSEAIALYQMGTPARNVKVAIPLGAEITAAEVTLSGASATGWASHIDNLRDDWEDGTPIDVDQRQNQLTIAMANSEEWFIPHDLDSQSSSSTAWYDNGSFSIRQPHTTNVTESRFSAQRTLQSGTGATYNAAVFKYRGMLFASTWDSSTISNSVKVLYTNNASQITTPPNNSPLRPDLDFGSCIGPTPPTSWQSYGWRDWAVTDDERVLGILSSYRGSNAIQNHRVVEWDIREPLAWKCISSYDVSTQSYGDYTAISYDRTRDSIWINHNVRKTLVQYEFNGDGTFTRNSTDYYTYFMSTGQVRGMAVHGQMFYFRSYFSWNNDQLSAYAITGDVGSTLTKQAGVASISQNGYGLQYDGQRLITLDHYSWSQGQQYREFGSGMTYLITATPGTSTWVSEPIVVDSEVIAANVDVSWSTTATGDRVEYWVSADNGTHWVPVTNDETVHFAYPGEQVRWKVQLVGTTAVSWWVNIEYSTEYTSSGEWLSPTLTTGTQVGHMRAEWVSDEPAGTEIGIMVSNDDGVNWLWAQNNVDIDWGNQVGNKLVYNVVLNSTDNSMTPSLDSLIMHYEEGYPSAVRLDIGDDGTNEYVGQGGLQDPVVVSGQALVDALNDHTPQNGIGSVNITFVIKAGSPGRVRLTDLDITYRFRTRVLDVGMEGGLLVPDGEWRVLVTHIALGDDATMLDKVDVELLSSYDSNPKMRWEVGDSCSEASDPDDYIIFDTGNCTAVLDASNVVNVRMPMQVNWIWNDESSMEARLFIDDNLGQVVDGWVTDSLDLRIENDIQLLDLRAVDESGRELMNYDWMRGGLNLTFSGGIAFEDTSLSPKAGHFFLELTGQNLTQDGIPMEEEYPFMIEANPAHGQYYLTLQTPIQSSQGGMLFRIKAVGMQAGSHYVNPTFNTVRIVLDGNSPLAISATPLDGSEQHAGLQSVTIVVQDSVDPPTQITLHYWVEDQDDLNYNRLADGDEYRTATLRSPEILGGGLNIFNGIIDDSWNNHGQIVSFYVSGEDQQNNQLAMGGGPVCPGGVVVCGFGGGEHPPDWGADMSTYTIREEFPPELDSDNSSLLGHDDSTPLHPGTAYVARLVLVDGNGGDDIMSVHLSLTGDLDDEQASIFANFTTPAEGHQMHLESASTAIAVSNLYSSYSTDSANHTLLILDIRFQLTWLFPEEFDTDGEQTYVPVVEVIDWPCDVDSMVPCHEDRGGLGFDEWSLDNDLRFDMSPGHFTAIDLATGRNLYRPGEDPELIAAGQVVRIGGRILFSEDNSPAPEGAFDIVVGDLERQWSAVPREGGDFTLDILVPNVRSGGLDMYAWLANLPGLADDETPSPPRIQLVVDGTPPEIRAIGPTGDIRLDQAMGLPVSLHVADEHGFDSERAAEIHWMIRAGTSEISRGNKQFSSGSPVGTDWMWEGTIDLTDAGSIELLPGYLVDVWITGSDEAGNPYLASNNTESSPLATWRLVRVGPMIDLRSDDTDVSWSDPSPTGGENVTLIVSGYNPGTESGEVTFILLENHDNGQWLKVSDVSSAVQIDAVSDWSVGIEVPTEEVEVNHVRRFQLVARDGHVDIDWLTIEPLTVEPKTARDGEALGDQIESSTGLFVLYIIALASLAFAVSMMVMYRKERQRNMDTELDMLDQADIIDDEDFPPPEGGMVMPPMSEKKNELPPPPAQSPAATAARTPPPPSPAAGTTPTSHSTASAPSDVPAPASTAATPIAAAQPSGNFSDDQLRDAGWSQAQVDAYRAQEAVSEAVGSQVAMQYSETVVRAVMKKYGLTNKEKFLRYAEFFDTDGNKYLKQDELESAAAEIKNSTMD